MLAVVGEADYLVFEAPAEASGLTMTAKVYDAADTLLATLPASEWTVAGVYRTDTPYSWPAEAFYTVVWSGAPGGDIGQGWQAVQPGSAAFALTGGVLTLDGVADIETVLGGSVDPPITLAGQAPGLTLDGVALVDLTLDAVCLPIHTLVAEVEG